MVEKEMGIIFSGSREGLSFLPPTPLQKVAEYLDTYGNYLFRRRKTEGEGDNFRSKILE